MRTRIQTILLTGAAILIAGAAAARTEGQVLPEKFVTEYKIGPKDVLEIKVVGQDKYNSVVRVSEEGKINFFPIVGDIDVSGLSASDIEKKVTRLLEEKYLNNPRVSVFIKEHLSRRVSVLGAVTKAGFVELQGRQTLLQVLTAAGGLTKDAGREINILRLLPDGSSASLKIPIDGLLDNGDPKLNIPVEPDDTVIVQVDRIVHIYVYGQVKNPGALQVMKSRIPDLTQAIAQAGGFTDRAALGGVVVKRKDEKGNEKNVEINVRDIQKGKKKDFPLMENDVVFVPETWI